MIAIRDCESDAAVIEATKLFKHGYAYSAFGPEGRTVTLYPTDKPIWWYWKVTLPKSEEVVCGRKPVRVDAVERQALRVLGQRIGAWNPFAHSPVDYKGWQQVLDGPRSIPLNGFRLVYFIEAVEVGLIKIGVAVSPERRRAELSEQSPVTLNLLATTPGDIHTERMLHHRFKHLRRRGEWFEAAPELLNYIRTRATPWQGRA